MRNEIINKFLIPHTGKYKIFTASVVGVLQDEYPNHWVTADVTVAAVIPSPPLVTVAVHQRRNERHHPKYNSGDDAVRRGYSRFLCFVANRFAHVVASGQGWGLFSAAN